jgi:hypothetical protein
MDVNITLRDFNEKHLPHTWSDFIYDGPSHMPTFRVYLFLNDTKFEGCGSSKKRAKINAIQKFKSNFTGDVRPVVASANGHVKPFTANINSNIKHSTVGDTNRGIKRSVENDCMESALCSPPLKKLTIDAVHQTSAISILHEIFPGQNFVYEHEPSHGLLECMSVMVFGNKYLGYGRNKREAKEIACRNALKTIYEVQPIDNKFKDQIEILRTDYRDAKIIDHFAYLTDVVYQQLDFDNIKNKEYSVIASIIKVNQLFIHF